MHRNDLGHQVVDVVSMQTKVSVEAIMSERGPRATRARRIACLAMRDRDMTYPEIGNVVGRDHTTIIEACKNASLEEIELAKQVSWTMQGDVYFLRLMPTESGDVEVAVADPRTGQRIVLEAALAGELLRSAFRTEPRVVGLQ